VSRQPKRLRPAQGYHGEGAELSDGPTRDNPLLYRAGIAVPDRAQEPPIGPAGGNVRAWLVEGEAPPTREGQHPRFTDELRSGVEVGTRGNTESTQKTCQEFGDARREQRGVRTRPPRPGQWC
jgi:hypothetical protein